MMMLKQTAFASITLAAALALATPLAAQDQPAKANWRESSAANDVQAPALTFEEINTDFGTADEGAKVDIEFPFINTSDRTITITNIKASCGCTAAQLEKKVFAPGEGESIRATFNTKGRTGTQHKTITITTDDTANPTYRVSFKGQVVSKVYIDEKLVNFGTIRQGDEMTKSFHIIDMSGENISIKNLTSAAGGLQFERGEPFDYTEEASGKSGRAIPITVTIPADYPQGPVATTVAVQTTYKDRPNFIATVRGIVRGEVTVQPAQLYFGFVQPGEEVMRNFALSVVDNKSFALKSYSVEPDAARSSAEMSDPVIEVTETEAGTPVEHNFAVKFVAPDENGRFTGDIILQGAVENEDRTLRIPYNAFVRQTAASKGDAESRVRTALQQRLKNENNVISSPRSQEKAVAGNE